MFSTQLIVYLLPDYPTTLDTTCPLQQLPRLNHGIRGFDWPPSSPDLNPIEKVWRWMKHEITKLETVSTTIEDLKEVLQELWNNVDPKDWRYLTERLTCKLEDVIESKGMATVH